MDFVIEPIPPGYLTRIRAAGADEAGNPLDERIEDEGGAPLRCCLRESRPGEHLLLIAYTPPGTVGAYAERGPVFVHAAECEGYPSVRDYPAGLGNRRQVVRAYDTEGNQHDGTLTEDTAEAERAIAGFLDDPAVGVVHVRNVVAGCYNFAARRV